MLVLKLYKLAFILKEFILMFCLFNAVPQKSLGDEVNELTSSRLLKLEKDNQTLLKTVEELRGAGGQDTTTKLAKLNQENQTLKQKVRRVIHIFCTLYIVYVPHTHAKSNDLIPSAAPLRFTLWVFTPSIYHAAIWLESFSHRTEKKKREKRKRGNTEKAEWYKGKAINPGCPALPSLFQSLTPKRPALREDS